MAFGFARPAVPVSTLELAESIREVSSSRASAGCVSMSASMWSLTGEAVAAVVVAVAIKLFLYNKSNNLKD